MKSKFSGTEWTEEKILLGWKLINEIGLKYKWFGYPIQFEILNIHQMLEKYALKGGLPISYTHWSIGKDLIELEKEYKNNTVGLAYELIINTDPSICYLLDNNTMLQQLLCTAHAAVGHAHFFRHNYLFKAWSNPKTILEYCTYSQNFINTIREREYSTEKSIFDYSYSIDWILDIALNLSDIAITFKPENLNTSNNKLLEKDILGHYDSVSDGKYADYIKKIREDQITSEVTKSNSNLLEFIIDNANENITDDHKEVIRIISNLEQYFYPNIQTKIMNEGFASFVHYVIMKEMYDKKFIDDEYYFEFIYNHVGVINQQPINKPEGLFYSINPYYLGFNMFMDIKRICENPTEEDKQFLPLYAGTDWNTTINFIVENYKDSTFIEEFLSPKLIRDLKLVEVSTHADAAYYEITKDHGKTYYDGIRQELSKQVSYSSYRPVLTITTSPSMFSSERELVNLCFEVNLDNSINKNSLGLLYRMLKKFLLKSNINLIIHQHYIGSDLTEVIMDEEQYELWRTEDEV